MNEYKTKLFETKKRMAKRVYTENTKSFQSIIDKAIAFIPQYESDHSSHDRSQMLKELQKMTNIVQRNEYNDSFAVADMEKMDEKVQSVLRYMNDAMKNLDKGAFLEAAAIANKLLENRSTSNQQSNIDEYCERMKAKAMVVNEDIDILNEDLEEAGITLDAISKIYIVVARRHGPDHGATQRYKCELDRQAAKNESIMKQLAMFEAFLVQVKIFCGDEAYEVVKDKIAKANQMAEKNAQVIAEIDELVYRNNERFVECGPGCRPPIEPMSAVGSAIFESRFGKIEPGSSDINLDDI